MLFPHVRATPETPYFDRARPQSLYLDPDSPLVPSLTFPDGFSVAKTPLVTFRGMELLLDEQQLVDLHRDLDAESTASQLDEYIWLLDPAECMRMFTAPLPQANYKTMVVSQPPQWFRPGFVANRCS
ncbi:hypothetical protein B0H19DRAFT_1168753, partial [Mycena capillaripes]